MVWEPLSSSLLLLLARSIWFYTAITYMSASWAVYINKYLASFHHHHGLATLAVSYNTIFPILLAFNFKKQQTICKPRHTNNFFKYFFPASIDIPLAKWAGLRFTCRRNILFYVKCLSVPFRSEVNWFRSLMIYKLLHICMPQCFLVRDLTQLLATRFLHPYSVIFRGSADKNVAGHQAKRTIVLRRCRSQNQ